MAFEVKGDCTMTYNHIVIIRFINFMRWRRWQLARGWWRLAQRRRRVAGGGAWRRAEAARGGTRRLRCVEL
jgi:hypothetical protein